MANGKGHNPNIATLQAQVVKLTCEVHNHNEELAVVKNDVSWIKNAHVDLGKRLDVIDARAWGILAGIVISIIVSVALRVL